MITRRSLFLGAAAVITTPGLLMPVRKLWVPDAIADQLWHPVLGVDWADPVKGDYTVIVRGFVGRIERIEIIDRIDATAMAVARGIGKTEINRHRAAG